jgi:hypothetical protein
MTIASAVDGRPQALEPAGDLPLSAVTGGPLVIRAD